MDDIARDFVFIIPVITEVTEWVEMCFKNPVSW